MDHPSTHFNSDQSIIRHVHDEPPAVTPCSCINLSYCSFSWRLHSWTRASTHAMQPKNDSYGPTRCACNLVRLGVSVCLVTFVPVSTASSIPRPSCTELPLICTPSTTDAGIDWSFGYCQNNSGHAEPVSPSFDHLCSLAADTRLEIMCGERWWSLRGRFLRTPSPSRIW
jgi:hypothetical protein